MTVQDFKQAQLRLGLTNKAMAELLGVTETYVEMLRAGTRTASRTIWRVIELTEQIEGDDNV